MFKKLAAVEMRYDELMALISDPAVQADPAAYRKHTKAISEIQLLVERFREYRKVVEESTQAMELSNDSEDDPELRELAREELREFETRRDSLLAEIKVLLIPKDPNDERNVVLEIRAGTGGDEAGLFAADLFGCTAVFPRRKGGD